MFRQPGPSRSPGNRIRNAPNWTNTTRLRSFVLSKAGYRPQTNGKAERFIQSALREWAYGFTYQHSNERTHALGRWNHHYNWHRPHQSIGGAIPMSRLGSSRNNLLTLHI